MPPAGHVISGAGVQFIGRWEGFRRRLYNDPLGHCTIGFGHLVHQGNCNGSEPGRFKRGITRRRGLKLLRKDIADYEAAINASVDVPLSQNQFDALVSFAYNVGVGAFSTSTLLRKLNRGKYESVLSELMRWTNGGLPGLVTRRRAEGDLFANGTYIELARLERQGIEGEPEQGRDASIAESPDELPPADMEGPADEGQHAEAGEDPADAGEPIDEGDTAEALQAVALPPATEKLKRSMAIAIDMGLLITSTTGPGHGPRSYHYRRPYRHIVVRGIRYEVARAQDAAKAGGNADRLYRRYFRRIEQMKPTELFYDPMGYSWLQGKKVDWTPGDHRDHVHVAF